MIALWAIAILTIFAIAIGRGARSKVEFVNRLSTRHRLRYIAEAGVKSAIAVISEKATDISFDVLLETWSLNPAFFKKIRIGIGSYSVGYDYRDPLSGEVREWYGTVDEERKININTAKYKTIGALLRIAAGMAKKEADDMAAAIVDWRDKNDFPLLNGAESRYYESRPVPYKSKSAKFETLGELMLVRDMTSEIYEKIEPYVTVYGTGRVNINTVSSVVLKALGVRGSLIRKIMSFRAGIDEEEGTFDDNMFVLSSSIAATLSQALPMSSEEVAILSNLSSAGVLDVASSAFSIKSVSRIGERPSVVEIRCVYDRNMVKSGEVAIKYWREKYYVEKGQEE